MAFIILAFFAGLIAGAVINALADDLPHTYRLRLPHYPDGERRPVIAWSGVLAFLLGKRRSAGGAALTWRHPLTELPRRCSSPPSPPIPDPTRSRAHCSSWATQPG